MIGIFIRLSTFIFFVAGTLKPHHSKMALIITKMNPYTHFVRIFEISETLLSYRNRGVYRDLRIQSMDCAILALGYLPPQFSRSGKFGTSLL